MVIVCMQKSNNDSMPSDEDEMMIVVAGSQLVSVMDFN